MLHLTVIMLTLAVIATGAATYEKDQIFQQRYTRWAAALWTAAFALGCATGWWQALDCLPILAAILLVCALRTLDPDIRFFSLIGAIVALEGWQFFRWNYDGWQLAAAILFAAVIPVLAYYDSTTWRQIWTERGNQGELYSLPTT